MQALPPPNEWWTCLFLLKLQFTISAFSQEEHINVRSLLYNMSNANLRLLASLSHQRSRRNWASAHQSRPFATSNIMEQNGLKPSFCGYCTRLEQRLGVTEGRTGTNAFQRNFCSVFINSELLHISYKMTVHVHVFSNFKVIVAYGVEFSSTMVMILSRQMHNRSGFL